MTLSTILIIVLILALIGALPNWGYSRGWGFAPSAIIGTILIILLILALFGRVWTSCASNFSEQRDACQLKRKGPVQLVRRSFEACSPVRRWRVQSLARST